MEKRIVLVVDSFGGSNTLALARFDQSVASATRHLLHISRNGHISDKVRSKMRLNTASAIVTTHGPPRWVLKTPIVETWHGFPFKSMGQFDKGLTPQQKRQITRTFKKCEVVISCSPMYSALMSACIGLDESRFRVCGFPRNDYLFSGRTLGLELLGRGSASRRNIFYLPTFRNGNGRNDGNARRSNMFGFEDWDVEALDDFLSQCNAFLYTKLHPLEEACLWTEFKSRGVKNIVVLEESWFASNRVDLYQLLPCADALITDYSSVYFDYLLLDRPIVFVPTDIDAYRKNRGLLLEPYEEWAKGPVALTQKELHDAIYQVLFVRDDWRSERNSLVRIVHTFRDAGSRQRVWDVIMEYVT